MSHEHAPHGWDGQASHYDHVMTALEPGLRHVTAALLDAAGVRAGTRVLDVACGPGHTTAAASARGATALGVDLSPQMVQAARVRFPGVAFQVGDMLQPPTGPWDAIVCRFGAHHVDPAWLAAAWRQLRPGGRLALAELAPVDDEARAKGMRESAHWVRLLGSAGFTDVRVAQHPMDLARHAEGNAELAALLAQGEGRRFEGTAYIVSGRRPGT